MQYRKTVRGCLLIEEVAECVNRSKLISTNTQ